MLFILLEKGRDQFCPKILTSSQRFQFKNEVYVEMVCNKKWEKCFTKAIVLMYIKEVLIALYNFIQNK